MTNNTQSFKKSKNNSVDVDKCTIKKKKKKDKHTLLDD